MIAQITKLYKMYEDITTRLAEGKPFTSARHAYDGYERLILVDDINIGLDYINSTATLHLVANNRTHTLAHILVATRRGRGDYEAHLTPQTFAQFSKDAFNLDSDTSALLGAYISAKTAHGAILNGRIERALTIASDGSIKCNGSGFQVDSQTGTGEHTVTFTDDVWDCTCQDPAPHIDAHKGCKHTLGVMMSIKAGIDIPQAEAKPAPAPSNGRRQPCRRCGRAWQQCQCPPVRSLPQPAKVTILSPEAKRKFEEMLDHAKARNEQGQKALDAALKPEARRRTRCQFTHIQKY